MTDEKTMLPKDFTDRMASLLKEEYPVFRASYEKERSYGLRFNSLKSDRETFLKRMPFMLEQIAWAEEGFYYRPEEQPNRGEMMISQICIITAIIAYLSIMIYVGISYSKNNTSIDAFYLGGRKLGPVVTAMSAEASDMSSWLLMGLPGVAYLSGIAEAGWTAIGLAVGTYVNWLIVSKKIRRYTSQLHALTLPDFFSKRYGDIVIPWIRSVVLTARKPPSVQ